VGASFPGHISGVTRFGLFVALDDLGAQGLIPIRSLGSDYFVHDELRHTLQGRNTGLTYALGDTVTVLLKEADPITGSLVFRIMDHDDAGLRLPPARVGGANMAAPGGDAGGRNPGGKLGKGVRRPGRKNSQRKPGKTRRK
jgi:ribonuclease R